MYGQSLIRNEEYDVTNPNEVGRRASGPTGQWLQLTQWQDYTSMQRPVDQSIIDQLCAEYLSHKPSKHSHHVFRKAGKLFDLIRLQKKSVKPKELKFRNESERRQALELAQVALPYLAVLQGVLHEVSFFNNFPQLDKMQGVVMVMLYDFIKRQFQPLGQQSGKALLDSISHVESALLSQKTAINAELARQRIQKDALTVEELLPQNLQRLIDVVPTLPQYAWVNLFKTSMRAVVLQLCKEGFCETDCKNTLADALFCRDQDCSDLLIFHANNRDKLLALELVESYHLIVQRKSSCLGSYTLANALLNRVTTDTEEESKVPQVLLTHLSQGWSAAHLASLLGNRATISCCVEEEKDLHQIQQRLMRIGAYNIKIIQEGFLDLNPEDNLYASVVAILAAPECSNTGVCDPVDYILREGGDVDLLRDTVSAGEYPRENLKLLQTHQKDILRHAFRFPNLELVVYCTHSIYSEENEQVIQDVLKEVNSEYKQQIQQQKKPQKKKFIQLEQPPDVKFKVEPNKLYTTIPVNEKTGCVHTQPSMWLEGYFLAVIKKQTELRIPAKEILSQAKAKGLLQTSYSSSDPIRTRSSTQSGNITTQSSKPSSVQLVSREMMSREHKCRVVNGEVLCSRCQRNSAFAANEAFIRQMSKSNQSSSQSVSASSPDYNSTSGSTNSTSPASWLPPHGRVPPFPILRPRTRNKRLVYPLATKTLHLAGLGPPIVYPPQYTITRLT